MKDLKYFENAFKDHLEEVFNSSKQTDKVKRLSEAEETVFEFINQYHKNSEMSARDIINCTNSILKDFGKEKINYID